MKNLFSKPSHSIIASIGAAAVICILIFAFTRHAQVLDTVAASYADISHVVTANGSVAADQSVSLTFDVQGKVDAVYVDVGSTTKAGDILASLDSGQIRANVAGAQADVDAAAAQLAKAESGARPEEKAIYVQKYADASDALLSALRNAYLQAQDAIVNKSDAVFSNGDTPNPTIAVRTQSTAEQTSINQERLALKDTLARWKTALASASSSDLSDQRAVATQSLDAVKLYLSDLSTIVGNLTPGNSGLSQTSISSYTTLINGASQEATAAVAAEQAADAAWSSARDSLTLENAGTQSEDIASRAAALAKAQAVLDGLQSQLRHTYIVAPFDGVVTAMNVKVGQVFVPGISADQDIRLISSGGYKIEAYVPETDVGALAPGQKASITFDAFGPGRAFPATVTLVDPAPTVSDGANSYKVTLRADDDSDLKPGLTANISISTSDKPHALVVPRGSIITKDSSSFVLVQGPNGFVERPVQLGITGRIAGAAGQYAEVLSGLEEGDLVARF